MLSQFNKQGIKILDIFFCPHLPKEQCACRKPNPGMFMNAKKVHRINLNKSWMIGDKETDIIGANAAGIRKTILVRSGHSIDEENSNATFIIDSIHESKRIITH
jgi:D-glycero-D-manno-heptose 1,7-bisphosphate phosphatase